MTYKYVLLFVIFCLGYTNFLQAQDSVKSIPTAIDSGITPKKVIDRNYTRQLRIGAEVSKPIIALFNNEKYGFEATFDYNFRKETFLVAELGYGGGNIDYEFLKYKSNNAFARVGVDASMFDALSNKDFDIVVVGARYGIGVGKRGDASFVVDNPFSNPVLDTAKAQNFTAHWIEIVAGIKVELMPSLFAGWNVRAKFLMNANTFNGKVAPNNIAGYGRADASTAIDFNFYIAYAIRWKNIPK